jgi:pSer/pThr/pTyr-binding forkhead associated (FHA) protein
MPLRLIIEDDEGTTTIVPLGADSITIGRQQGNTIQLTEKNVSRRHARLTPDADGWTIEDLNSYNGVKVNGQTAEGLIALKEGDVIQIGDYHLALTEDVDKRTLNYDGREAANDPGVEPLLASSSSDLPRLSPDELAALSSGPQTPQPAAMLMDSGPVPAATGLPSSYADDRPQAASKGVLVVAGAAVVALLLAGGWWISQDGAPAPDKKVATSADSGAAAQQANVPAGTVDDPAVGSAGDVAPPDDVPGAEADSSEVADPSGDALDESAGEDEDIDDSGGDPEEGSSRTTKKPRKNRRDKPKKKPEKPTTTPEPVPAGPTPEELLKDARRLQFKEPGRAYALAKQSYSIKRSQGALISRAKKRASTSGSRPQSSACA